MLRVGLILSSEDGAAYVPFARGKLRYFSSIWNGGYVSHTIRNDDVLILFELWSKDDGRITITTSGYMESGVLDLQHTWRGNELTYKPAKVIFTPVVEGLKNELPVAGSRKVENGDDSWSMAGCAEKIKEVSIQMGVDEESLREFKSDPAAYCEPGQIELGKQMMISIPSSVYTGKLKLFVQALYGSKRTDYKYMPGVFGYLRLGTGVMTVPPPNSSAEPEEIFADVLNQMPTTGLFTVSKGKYLLITIASNEVTFRKMNRKYGVHPVDSDDDLAEAYTLATLVPSAEVKVATGPDMRNYPGQPLAYGWHFNETGNEASVVLRKTKYDIDGVRLSDGAASKIDGFETRLYQIKFSYNEDDDALSYNVSTLAGGLHIPYIQSKFFTPALDGSGMQMLLPPGMAPWNCYADLEYAPMYCYYGTNDTLQIVRANNTRLRITPAFNQHNGINPNDGASLFGGPTTEAHGPKDFELRPASFDFVAVGIVSADFDFAGENRTSLGSTTYYHYGLSLDGDITPGYGFFEFDTALGYEVQHRGTLFYTAVGESGVEKGSTYSFVTKADDSFGTVAICVIPYGDASAVIAGVEKVRQGIFTGGLVAMLGSAIRWKYVEDTPSPGAVRMSEWRNYGVFWSTLADQNSEIATKGRKKNAGKNTMYRYLALYAAGQRIVLADYADEATDNSNVFEAAPFNNLFRATPFGNPVYPARMTVNTSYSGALQHSFCLPKIDPKKPWVSMFGWPDKQFTAAVGYA